jgi:HEAT repeat protein
MYPRRTLLMAGLLLGAASLAPAQQAPTTGRLEGIATRLDAGGGDDLLLRNEIELALRMDPAAAREVHGLLRTGGVTDGTAALLICKLEVVGSAEAQDGLRHILDDRSLSTMNRTRALIAIGGLARPDEASVEILWSAFSTRADPTARELSNTAALSLGILAHTLAVQDPARANALGQRLAETLRASSDPVATAMLLRSLGNSGAAALLDSAIPFLFDPEPLVRSAAAHAVGRLPREGSAELLALCLSREPQGLVRASIAQGLVHLGEPDTRALRIVDQGVTDESHDVARLAMARYLVDHMDAYPASRTTLTSMRDRDPSRSIRLLLLEALGI